MVPWRLLRAQPLPEIRLRVMFVDGTEGVVDMQRFLTSSTVLGTIFEPLRAPQEFGRVRIELGTLVWPNGADLAPDAIYDAIRETGRWVA